MAKQQSAMNCAVLKANPILDTAYLLASPCTSINYS